MKKEESDEEVIDKLLLEMVEDFSEMTDEQIEAMKAALEDIKES